MRALLLLRPALSLLSICLGVGTLFGQNSYYSDNFNTFNSAAWYYPAGSGLLFGNPPGLRSDGYVQYDSLIAKDATGTGGASSRHEVKATFTSLPSGPWWYSASLFLATNSTATQGYRIAIQAGSFTVYDFSGAIYNATAIGGSSFPYSGGPITFRAIKTTDGIRVVTGSTIFHLQPVGTKIGGPGVGFTSGGLGVAVSQAQLIAADTTAPTNVTGLQGSGTSNQVNLQWTGASDEPGGSGFLRYNIYRNNVLLGSSFVGSYTDPSPSPGTNYTYKVTSEDFHANESTGVTVAVSTGTVVTMADPHAPRQTGVRPLGSYWGAAGENIDMRSGNLNFSLPLLKAQGRNGVSLALGLSYNSQNWRLNGADTYNLGIDVGYGYGWRLMAGSILPVYASPGVISHYLYTDATGAAYQLSVNEGGVWWGKEGLYVAYDAAAQRLRFMDGSFWVMGAVSAGSEADAGTRYPTRIQDSNGNYLTIDYKEGSGLGGGVLDSSARLHSVKDIRNHPNQTYSFFYNTDSPTPHLTTITANIPTGESYSLAYTGRTLRSPFSATASYGTATTLQSLTATGPGLAHAFAYGTSSTETNGELTKVTFPYGGELRWTYQTSAAYPNGTVLREVQNRELVKQTGAAAKVYQVVYGSGTSGIHAFGAVKDPNTVSEKRWNFETNTASASYGLLKIQEDRLQNSSTIKRSSEVTWTADERGNRYLAMSLSTLDPGQSYVKVLKSEQVLDKYGNVTTAKTYPFGNLTTPATVKTFTYLHSTAYDQRFIFNRLTASSIALNGGTAIPYTIATYDEYPSGLMPRSGEAVYLHDSANYGQSMLVRGNRTGGGIQGGYASTTLYDMTGFAIGSTNGGTSAAVTPDPKNVAAQTMTLNNDGLTAMTAGFNSIYQVTSMSGPNNTSVSIGYDANARPTTSTSATGAVTFFDYFDSLRMKKARTGSHWVKTYFDGFGRTIKEVTGHGHPTETIVSTVETEYDSCGCSPLGKVRQVSRPYGPGGSATLWTVYTYDSLGRVITVAQPNNAGNTTYEYTGNVTKVTSPAGKWKQHEVDALGNLVTVTEPNPAGGANLITLYTYNDRNQLATVTMTRATGSQTRTFTYDANGKVLTAQNPETGLVTNTYEPATGLLKTKVDAKQNKVEYFYDNRKRVTEIKRWECVPPTPPATGACSLVERPEQATKFVYDANPVPDDFAPEYLAGRLAYVETYSKRGGATWNAPGGGNAWETLTFREMYSYTMAGQMKKKRLKVSGRHSPAQPVASDYLESSYTFDSEGRMLTQTYPAAHSLVGTTELAGASYTYGFDTMGRPKTMTQGATPVITDVTYNAAGQPTAVTSGIWWANSEARVYNDLGQMTKLTNGSMRFEYDFSATANDGRITAARSYSLTNLTESVSYQYDQLNRLTNATGSAGGTAWSAGYEYDGFGNLLTVTPSGGGPSPMNVTVDAANNRVNGWSYDANGNVTAMPGGISGGVYDIENRLVEASRNAAVKYGYGADNRRVFESKRVAVNSGGDTIEEVVTWWSGQQRIGRYKIRWNDQAPNNGAPNSFVFARMEAENVYFAGRPLTLGAETNVWVDRLGSVRRSGRDYFPYGQEAPSTTTGGKEKYGTYRHDGETDLSYADQRYYATGAGRFMSADPYEASAGAGDPGSWNRYAYTRNEPLGRIDPEGLADFDVTGYCVGCGGAGIPGGLPFGGGVGGGQEGASWMWHEDNDALWMAYRFQGATMRAGGGGSSGSHLEDVFNRINDEIHQGKISNCGGFVAFLGEAIATNSVSQAANMMAPGANAGGGGRGFNFASSPNGGGWNSQYQAGFGTALGPSANGSQAHHAMGFFFLGYTGGTAESIVAASFVREFTDAVSRPVPPGLGSGNYPDRLAKNFDWGDFNLGVAAGMAGIEFRDGKLSLDDLKKTLCAQ